MSYRKKLIEVALPLIAINRASAIEKSVRHGHPSTLHLWWARRPLAACRAVLFASLVDDPSGHLEEFPTEEAQEQERERLFRLIEELVKWENSNDEHLLEQARAEIGKSTNGTLPPVLDPFAGGGSIPLEAQRLGLESHASDLNPVAVLINKALIEIPPKFAGRSPVNSRARQDLMDADWSGVRGLADDIRYYGRWMRDEAEKRIGHLYPKVTLPKEQGGGEATVIAWLWTRTVTCPNPACGVQMPLVRSFYLSKKKGKEAWVEPQVDHCTTPPVVRFTVGTGKGKPSEGTINRLGAKCIVCGTSVPFDYVRGEGNASRMGAQLMAVVADGQHERLYLAPNEKHSIIATLEDPVKAPETNLPEQALGFRVQRYGMTRHRDLFTSRQLVALTTFSDLVQEARALVLKDSGSDEAYANAVATYLAMGVSRLSDICNSLCRWENTKTQVRNLFTRQAISMLWDFAEPNVFADAAGDFGVSIGNLVKALETTPAKGRGIVQQQDATAMSNSARYYLISTDPPYYDNIGYADLSDFFYVWLRRSLANIYPELFRTMLVPKKQELIAAPYRFNGDKKQAQDFFEVGLGKAFECMRQVQHPDYPLTVYYAFKQAEAEAEDEEQQNPNGKRKNMAAIASTGWETMLEGLIRAGFSITGTWPVRTELANRTRGLDSNALASSIVLVCRQRAMNAPVATRLEFLRALKAELPEALRKLQHANIAAVDLEQALLGPGMAIYSRYSKVVEPDGTPLKVRVALQLINQIRSEIEGEEDSAYDTGTQWVIKWFESYGMNAGLYGDAETLSKSKNMSVASLEHAGLIIARAGRVHLRVREELPPPGDLRARKDLSTWEVMQRMIQELMKGDTEVGAARILRQASEHADALRSLVYRLFTLCERKGMAQEAMPYNTLATSWPEIMRLAYLENEAQPEQSTLF